jgi:hypothetical protein
MIIDFLFFLRRARVPNVDRQSHGFQSHERDKQSTTRL